MHTSTALTANLSNMICACSVLTSQVKSTDADAVLQCACYLRKWYEKVVKYDN